MRKSSISILESFTKPYLRLWDSSESQGKLWRKDGTVANLSRDVQSTKITPKSALMTHSKGSKKQLRTTSKGLQASWPLVKVGVLVWDSVKKHLLESSKAKPQPTRETERIVWQLPQNIFITTKSFGKIFYGRTKANEPNVVSQFLIWAVHFNAKGGIKILHNFMDDGNGATYSQTKW